MAQDIGYKPAKTTLGNLLKLIQHRLLVIELPSSLGSSSDLASPSSASNRSRKSSINSTVSEAVLTPQSDIPAFTFSEALHPSPPAIVVHDAISPPETVIAISPQTPQASLGGRALAKELFTRMLHIEQEEDGPYWFTDIPDRKPPSVKGFASADKHFNDYTGRMSEYLYNTIDTIQPVSPSGRPPVANPGLVTNSLVVTQTERVDYGSKRLDTDWEITVYNDFATELFEKSEPVSLPSATKPSSKLCQDCQDFRHALWNPGFARTYNLLQVKKAYNNQSCRLCRLFWRTLAHSKIKDTQRPNTLLVQRIRSHLKINTSNDLSLSIFRSPTLDICAS
ncbi:hypothetical protein B0T21DRAFT_352758 [Apiosordaria backusii]|uniref:Uncharacterized protein n=1 Tax=Apiosordaria backusii TaxID=314023 RepID=A0AA40A7F4_9PEZI|nr:hypothetical protein B0T21DRAFT_352758 [Apiosordaria backusii]